MSKYPKLEKLELYQEKRGLSLDMLDKIEVQEIVCGVSSKPEIEEIHEWVTKMNKKDQATFGTRVISMDVEDVKVTFYDTLRMAGSWRSVLRMLYSKFRIV